MLQRLEINNYALIEHLDIEFHPGFSVITGETGAGKSIILGALGLLLGGRADSRTLGQGANRCTIEATFDITGLPLQAFFEAEDFDYDPTECTIRREVSAAGKSRSFINDTPATLSQLRDLGGRLVDIHSQHQNLLLSQEHFQIDILDTLAGNSELLEVYGSHYKAYQQLLHQIEDAEATLQKNRADEEYLRFQLQQLDEAELSDPDEQEELETEQQTLSHAEDIKAGLYEVLQTLDGDDSTLSRLRTSCRTLENLARIYPPAEDPSEHLSSLSTDLKELLRDMQQMAERVDYDPQRLEIVNQRLSLFYTLQQKHHVNTLAELIQLQQEIQDKLNAIDGGDAHLDTLRKQAGETLKKATQQAALITKARQKAARECEKELQQHLVPLGIPNVQIQFQITPLQILDTHGADSVTILFSANKNAPLMPVAEVASGGEIARVMLSIKALLSKTSSLPTLIFDEIDTGVSGAVADKMAQMMHLMGQSGTQVISITHLPQIAATGSHHYRVYKADDADATHTHLVALTPDERVTEIAHMLSGTTLTDSALTHARQLLKQ